MLKTLVSLVLLLVLSFFIVDQKNVVLPVFSLLEEPTIITNGQNGQTLVIEITYSHDKLFELLQSLEHTAALILVSNEWAERSVDEIAALLALKLPIGLYGMADYANNPQLLSKDIQQFETTFEKKPLYFSAPYDNLSAQNVTALYEQQINVIMPSVIYQNQLKHPLPNGAFVTVPLHRHIQLDFPKLKTFIQAQPFLSIEENIFGYTLTTKRSP